MKFLVLGATGPTGAHFLDRAIEHGDEVTALVRRPEALAQLEGRVEVVRGDATSLSDVSRAVDGKDAVVSALGRGKSVRADGLFTNAMSSVTTAMASTSTTRLVWLSSFGVGATYASASPLQKAMYSSFLRNIYSDKAAAEEILKASNLDWTLVYPSTLTDGAARNAYRVSDRLPMKGAPTVSRADVAQFMHAAVHDPTWIGRDAVITD